MIHGELSEIDAILTTPNLEVMKILNGGLLWRKHQDYIFLIIFSNHHCHMGICPEIEIRICLLCCMLDILFHYITTFIKVRVASDP